MTTAELRDHHLTQMGHALKTVEKFAADPTYQLGGYYESKAAFHRDAAEYVRKLEEALKDTAIRLERSAEDCSCSGGCHYCAADRRSVMRAREALGPYRAPEHPVEPEMKA